MTDPQAHIQSNAAKINELNETIRFTMWSVFKLERVLGDDDAQRKTEAGELEARRRAQQVDWTWQMVRDTVLDRVLSNPKVRKMRADIERQVKTGELTPALAAEQILTAASE